MPLCPSCRTEQSKRKEGRCPQCGTPVELHAGYWYRKSIGSPTVSILEYFERKVSDQMSAGRSVRVPFSIPRKSARYGRELKHIERMLQDVEGDYNLVIEALDVLFSDKRLNYKTRNSLLFLYGDYDLALALARSNREQSALAKEREQRVVQRLQEAEDVFA